MNAALQVIRAALFGAFWGSALFFAVGVALALGVDQLLVRSSIAPQTAAVRLGMAVVPPLALLVCGAYVVALRQGVARVVALFVENELTERLYTRIRPDVRATAVKLRDTSGPLTDKDAVRSIRTAIAEQRAAEAAPSSTRERLLRAAIGRAEGALASLLLMEDGRLPPRDELVARVESVGVERFEELIAELFERVYTAQLLTALALAAAVCSLPYALYLVSSA